MKRLFFIFFSFFSFLAIYAAETSISGVAKSYAGKMLSLKIYTDQIIRNERILAETLVDTSGFFSFVADLPHTVQAFIPMDLYNGFIYLQPGKEYMISLPDYVEKSLPQKLDPYFVPTDYLLEIVGMKPGDFNFQMMEFEEAFDFYTMKHLVYGTNRDSISSSILQMREIFSDLTDGYQREFMEYRFLLLMNLSPQNTADSIIVRLNGIGADVYNPAFWDIFDNVFADFIRHSGDSEEYFIFKKIIEDGNVPMYFAFLKNRYGITDVNLRELTAIKLIADLINVDDFDKLKVIELLQRLGGGILMELNRELLASVMMKATANFIGTPAPDFTGIDPENNLHALSDYKGKYVYLNFGNTQVDQTLKDLNVLLRFYNNYKNELVILNVFLYDDMAQVARIASTYKEQMVFLYVSDPDSLKKAYYIQNVPSFFLIDPDGNFLMSKGTEPNDELRLFLQKIMDGKN